MNIKRYETKDNWSNKSGTYIPVFSEHEDGEWVKYSDAKDIIDELNLLPTEKICPVCGGSGHIGFTLSIESILEGNK